MKRLLLALMLMAGPAFGLSSEKTTNITVGASSGHDYKQFEFDVSGFDDVNFTFYFNQSVNDASFYFKLSRDSYTGRLNYINYTPTDISVANSTTVTFFIDRTNIPPDNTYFGDLWGADSSNNAQSYARGMVHVTDSLFDDSDSFIFPVPGSGSVFGASGGEFITVHSTSSQAAVTMAATGSSSHTVYRDGSGNIGALGWFGGTFGMGIGGADQIITDVVVLGRTEADPKSFYRDGSITMEGNAQWGGYTISNVAQYAYTNNQTVQDRIIVWADAVSSGVDNVWVDVTNNRTAMNTISSSWATLVNTNAHLASNNFDRIDAVSNGIGIGVTVTNLITASNALNTRITLVLTSLQHSILIVSNELDNEVSSLTNGFVQLSNTNLYSLTVASNSLRTGVDSNQSFATINQGALNAASNYLYTYVATNESRTTFSSNWSASVFTALLTTQDYLHGEVVALTNLDLGDVVTTSDQVSILTNNTGYASTGSPALYVWDHVITGDITSVYASGALRRVYFGTNVVREVGTLRFATNFHLHNGLVIQSNNVNFNGNSATNVEHAEITTIFLTDSINYDDNGTQQLQLISKDAELVYTGITQATWSDGFNIGGNGALLAGVRITNWPGLHRPSVYDVIGKYDPSGPNGSLIPNWTNVQLDFVAPTGFVTGVYSFYADYTNSVVPAYTVWDIVHWANTNTPTTVNVYRLARENVIDADRGISASITITGMTPSVDHSIYVRVSQTNYGGGAVNLEFGRAGMVLYHE